MRANKIEVKVSSSRENWKVIIRYYNYGRNTRTSYGTSGNLRFSSGNKKTNTKIAQDEIYISKDLKDLDYKLNMLKGLYNQESIKNEIIIALKKITDEEYYNNVLKNYILNENEEDDFENGGRKIIMSLFISLTIIIMSMSLLFIII